MKTIVSIFQNRRPRPGRASSKTLCKCGLAAVLAGSRQRLVKHDPSDYPDKWLHGPPAFTRYGHHISVRGAAGRDLGML